MAVLLPGTYPQAIVDYLVSVYFHDAQDIYVNLYVPSIATWPRSNGIVTLTQETDYPDSGHVKIHVEPTVETEFTIHLALLHGAVKPQPSQ